MTCETTGWCSVGFTTTVDGRNMVNYDIAVAGYASGVGYIDDHWSTSLGYPPKDRTQNYDLIAASESGSTTVVEFSRDAITGDDAKDVQFMKDTEVKVVYAYHTNSDASGGLPKHTNSGILDGKHNLILMAISAMQLSSTVMPPTSTVMPPTSTVMPSASTVMPPTSIVMPPTSPKVSGGSGVIGPYFSFYIVLACLSVYFMCF